jgi:hypothetical protein
MFFPSTIDSVLEGMRSAKLEFLCNSLVAQKTVVVMALAELNFQRFDKATEQKLEKVGFELVEIEEDAHYYLYEGDGSQRGSVKAKRFLATFTAR